MTPPEVQTEDEMPTYEYRCKSCDHEFEIVQSFSDEALTTCPECEGSLKKVFGNVGISFKGSGFYKTDSRSAGSFGSTKDADRSDKKPASDSSSSGSDGAASSSSSESSPASGGADKSSSASASS